jgi:hypothetical protein
LDTLTPLALEVALSVQAELEARADEADRLRRSHVERARHRAELARRRYLAVDPDNRLVADSLEGDWNDALRALQAARDDYERASATAQAALSDEHKARVRALAADFPALWSNPDTPQRERKRIARLLIADVTLDKTDQIHLHVRFRGGQASSLSIPAPLGAPDLRRTSPTVIAQIDRLLDHHTEAGVAAALNHAGVVSGTGQAFHAGMISHLRKHHALRSREDRLRAQGLVGLVEIAGRLGVCTATVKRWRHEGRLLGRPFNDKGECLYEIPAVPPFKSIGRPPMGGRPSK